jgi:four helix bundle protein
VSISYKECLETKYWLSIMKDTGYITFEEYESLFSDADELCKILYSILKKTRIKQSTVSS